MQKSSQNLPDLLIFPGVGNLLLLGLLLFAAACSGIPEKQGRLFQLHSEKDLQFSLWREGEPCEILFNGFMDDPEHPGEKLYKIELMFSKMSSVILGAPVLIPVENPLQASFTCKIETASGGACSVGFLADIKPGFTGYVIRESVPAATGWQTVSIDNVYEHCRDTAIPLIAKKYYLDTEPENFTACLTRIGLFVSGKAGTRISVFLKKLDISGEALSETQIRKRIDARWAPAKARIEAKVQQWEIEAGEQRSKLAAMSLQTEEAGRIKTGLMEKLQGVEKQLAQAKTNGWLRAKQEIELTADLKVLDEANPLEIDQFLRQQDNPLYIPHIVKPVSARKILPGDAFISGHCSTELSLNAAPGEFEPASFVLKALAAMPSTLAQAGDLTSPSGHSIPAANVDIKLVKCWYQAGTAWYDSEQLRTQRVMVPELLLNDETLIKVDAQQQKNYLRLAFPDAERYEWISDPKEASQGPYKILEIRNFPVKDAPRLCPVNIPAGVNQQFWVTVKIPEGAVAGLYTGTIALSSQGKPVGSFTLKVNVYPFVLDEPYYTSSIYYRGFLSDKYPEGTISSEGKSEQQLAAELKNLVEHGISNPTCYQNFNSPSLAKHLELRETAGIRTDDFYSCYGTSIECEDTDESREALRKRVTEAIAFLKPFGIKNVFFYGRDEATGEKLMAQRKAWNIVHEAGGKVFVAGKKEENFSKMGDVQDLLISAFELSPEEAAKWHANNHKIWSYANPQSGVENPAVYRSNYGLLIWQNNYDGACTFAYQQSYGNIWNDFDGHYRDQNFTYPTLDGVIDTIAWEGYREAVDDIRYITTLLNKINKIKQENNSAKLKTVAEAEKYLQNIKSADILTLDLDAMRSKIAEYLIGLQD